MSQENIVTSSNIEDGDLCPICGLEPFCGGLGLVRYEVPTDDPRFGKLFRCPNNPQEQDFNYQERLRTLSNLASLTDKTFANFEIDLAMHTLAEQESLTLALRSAERFAEEPVGWLLLEGTYGCGKTHLAAAVGNARLSQGDEVLFITTPDLLDHLRASYGPSSEIAYDKLFEQVRNTPVLILDDLGVENPSAWAQEKLFQLLNHRYTLQLPTIITTNTSVETLDARIRSRVSDILLVQSIIINAPDFRSIGKSLVRAFESNLSLYADMTFETFETDHYCLPEEKQNLKKALKRAYEFAKDTEGWLVYTGSYGTGKTHLAAAIAQYKQDEGVQVLFLTVPDLLDYLRLAYSPDARVSFDKRFQSVRNTSLLILDDLGTENATSWAKEKLFQVLDYRYLLKLPTVITTSREIETLDERIATRLLDTRRCKRFGIITRSYASRIPPPTY